jgi:hypothetical protein
VEPPVDLGGAEDQLEQRRVIQGADLVRSPIVAEQAILMRVGGGGRALRLLLWFERQRHSGDLNSVRGAAAGARVKPGAAPEELIA